MQSRSRSHLLKFEYGDDHHTLGAQIRTLDNKIGSRKIENRNYQANYNFNNNSYLDLNLMAAHNIGKTIYPKGGFLLAGKWQINLSQKMWQILLILTTAILSCCQKKSI